VQLTTLVEKLSGVQPSSGEIRPEKVADIGGKLAQANYSISGQDVAAKLMLALQT
jgi:negative regulator of flagellin synthesis FlgM